MLTAAAISALPEPGVINAWVAFSTGPVFHLRTLHHQLIGLVLILALKPTMLYSHLVKSACSLYYPSAPLVPKGAKPRQRPVPEVVNCPRTSFIVRSHSSHSLCSTFPFLLEDAHQTLCSGRSISSVSFFFGYTLDQYPRRVFFRRFHCHRAACEPPCWQLNALILEINAKRSRAF